MRSICALALVVLLAGCAAPAGSPARAGGSARSAPVRGADWKPLELRQPAFFVRVAFASGQFEERERGSLRGEYEGALLEGLNRKAILVRDVQFLGERDRRLDAGAALARAREVGADHAVLVDVQVGRGVATFCRETRRPLRGQATMWDQEVEVLRVADGASRLSLAHGGALAATDVDVNCDQPRESRKRSPAETVSDAVDRLLGRLLGS